MDRPPRLAVDLRRMPRERLWAPGTLQAGGGRQLDCLIEDLSARGARVVGEDGLGPDAVVHLALQLPGQPPLERSAEVIYRAALAGGKQVAYGLRLAPPPAAAAIEPDAPPPRHTLVVDGRSVHCRQLVQSLHRLGVRPLGVDSLGAASRWLQRAGATFWALVICDRELTTRTGEQWLAAAATRWPRCRRLILTDPTYAPASPLAPPTTLMLPAPWTGERLLEGLQRLGSGVAPV